MTMRALVTHEERRDAALDVAGYLCDAGAGIAAKYPSGSTFTAVGLSDNGDAIIHVEQPDRTDAVERIPRASLRFLGSGQAAKRSSSRNRGLISHVVVRKKKTPRT